MLTPLDFKFECSCWSLSSICALLGIGHSVYNPKACASKVRQFIVELVNTKSLGKATGSKTSIMGSG